MNKSIFLSTIFHIMIISLTAISFPYMVKKPIDLPPIISIELIQISDITNIPYAPKAKKILEKIKKEKERVVSEQAPPKIVKKEKPDAIPLPKDAKKKKKIKTKKQNPKKLIQTLTQYNAGLTLVNISRILIFNSTSCCKISSSTPTLLEATT